MTEDFNKSEEKKPVRAGGEKLVIENKDVWEKAREDSYLAEKEETKKTELSFEEKEAIEEQLKREIELMELDKGLVAEADKKAKKIEFLNEKEKLERLLIIARERGLAFAVNVAKNMNDPFVLDSFHDLLIKEGLYRKFLK